MSSVDRSLSLHARIDVVIVSLVLAYVSWRFVEVPFRNKALFTRKQIFAFAFSAMTITHIIAFVMLNADGNRMILNVSRLSKHTSDDYLIDLQPSILSNYVEKRFPGLDQSDVL